MIAALDSSFDRPTRDQLRQARAAGVRMWWGYFGSRDGLGLATRWTRADFALVQEEGLQAGGFCSGLDDPAWIRATAAAWGILAAVDVEPRIRDDGDWVDDWVTVAQAGLYGLASVHFHPGRPVGRGALFNIVADYLTRGCTGETWPGWLPRPPRCGWQCQGTHSEFGLSVDRSALDDWYGGDMRLEPDDPIVKELRQNAGVAASIVSLGKTIDPTTGQPVPGSQGWLVEQVNQLTGYSAGVAQRVQAELDTMQQELAGLVAQGMPPADLQPLQDAIARLSAHLGIGTA